MANAGGGQLGSMHPPFEAAQPFLCCRFTMTNLMAGDKGIDAK